MKRKIILGLAALFVAATLSAKDYTKYVNTLAGTDLHGHTFPAATMPFGMIQAGPDTRTKGWDGCSGYHYSDSTILGFTHTHLSGVGCSDCGDILFMPVIDSVVVSPFRHSREKAEPGFYEVFLDHQKTLVKIASGRRAAMHEYSYPKGSERGIVIDLYHRDRLLASSIETVGDNAVCGWRRSRSWAKKQDVYFYAEFSENFTGVEKTDSALMRLEFGTGGKPLNVRIAISSVSCENARENLHSEITDWDLEALRKKADEAWNGWLSRIDIKAPKADKKTFYTSLYHAAIHPSLYSDVNGEYRGMDREVHKAEGFERYTYFSIWDAYRAAFPLYNIIARDYLGDFLESMLSIFNENGRLPQWELAGCETDCMIGFNVVSIVADAIVKGNVPENRIREYYEAMKKTAANTRYGYVQFGEYRYDPAGEDNESVSKTLEFAYDDWCIAVVASLLGETEDYAKYIERAQYYKNIFDSETGFMRPRELGNWAPDFDPTDVSSHFTEANSWQYSFYVPQDIAGHIELLGGEENYISKLDGLFSAGNEGIEQQLVDVTGLIGQYAHGNEPSHHIAFLYDFAGRPWRTQELTRRICREFYSSGADGYCGNEDCGQMSAWYIMSALGIYSVTPGTTTLALTSPLVRKAVLDLGDGKFTITADKPSSTYIGSVELNGVKIDAAAIDSRDMKDGGSMNFKMAKKATDFGREPVLVTSIPEEYRYEAYFEENFGKLSFTPKAITMKAYPQTEYTSAYTAGGPDGLVDGIHGKINWRAGGWQGYKHTDIDVIIDLLGTKTVRTIGAEFLQDMENYIWMPKDMIVYVSKDGKNFKEVGRRESDVAIDEEKVLIENWVVDFAPEKASHVRVVAHLFGEIPSWHRGYGDVGFTFIDEIEVK